MTTEKTAHDTSKKIRILILYCFFFSGLTGLIYEILWTRMIVKIIGGAPFAVSIILTIFMGGLGLGSFIAGRTVDRVKNPIKLVTIYGLLELVIGIYALLIPIILAAFKPIYSALYNQLFSHFILYNTLTFWGCFIILCIPVICMGATLPVLCRFYVTRLSHLGTNAGRLYGLNTIGAAMGALICGFCLINLLGMAGSLLFAVTINITIGLLCVLTSYTFHQSVEESPSYTDAITPPPLESEMAGSCTPANGVLVIFAVSGFCAMAYEVIWTKLLGLIVGPTTYSFTIVLVTFILGLALGSMLFGRLGDKTKKVFWLLIFTQFIAAFFVLLISQVLGNSQLFFAKLIYGLKDKFLLLSMTIFFMLFVFMILPTLCLGATFPLVSKIYTRSIAKVGKSIGFAYLINAIGAVSGAFCAGFILIPLLGKEKSLSLVISLQLITSLVVGGYIILKQKQKLLKLTCLSVPTLAVILLCFYLPRWNRSSLATGKYNRFSRIGLEENIISHSWLETLIHGPEIIDKAYAGEVVFYGDGIGGFTTVLKEVDPFGNSIYSMAHSGKVDASTRGDMKTQTLVAHFPMLFHPDPKKVMVLGLASGITAGEILNYPIEQLDVIDINRQVVEASKFFIPWNNNVLSNPKTNLIIQDGRAHLLLTKQKYDVIISEPSNPWMQGLATLFTQDFFKLAHDGLTENGIFIQFIPAYEIDWPAFASVGRAFTEVFPNSIMLVAHPSQAGIDYLLVGLKSKMPLNFQNTEQNLRYAQNSTNIQLSDARLLYQLIVCEDLQSLFGQGIVNTDNHPYLEFSAPKFMYSKGSEIKEIIQSRKQLRNKTENIVNQIETNVDLQIGFAAYSLSVYCPFANMVDLRKANEAQKNSFLNIVENYCSNNPIDISIFNNDQELKQKVLSTQIAALESKIHNTPDKAFTHSCLANLYKIKGESNKAIEHLAKAVKIKPDFVVAHYKLGLLLLEQQKNDEAIKHFEKALQLEPKSIRIHHKLADIFGSQNKYQQAAEHLMAIINITPDNASIYAKLGYNLTKAEKINQAIKYFKQSLKLNPKSSMTHYLFADALIRKGYINEVIKHLRKAIEKTPGWILPVNDLAWLLATCTDTRLRDPQEAVRLAEYACKATKYENIAFLDTLAVAYASDGRYSDAVATAEKALELCESFGKKEAAEDIHKKLKLYKTNKPYEEF